MLQDRKPYVIIAQQEWSLHLGSNARNLAMEISKTRLVLYVDPALDVNTAIKQYKTPHGKRRLRAAFGKGDNVIKVSENLWVLTPDTLSLSINWLKGTHFFDTLNKRNASRFFASIAKAIGQLGWKQNDCTIFNDSQMFTGRYVKKYLQPANNFYYIRDNLIKHPYFVRHGSRIEPQTIREADVVFANSAYLASYATHYNSNSYDIGQGCELEVYNAEADYVEPSDISTIPHPRIGYVGFLTGERLDISLLEKIAKQKPQWQIVLIGPEEEMFEQSKLHNMPNVYFLGTKKGSELPAYLHYLDVCINPQLVNDLTVGNYPRKIDEYLAMGKPTVATDTPAMQMFLPHVHLAVGVDGYVRAIEHALKPMSEEERKAAIAFAKSHTWDACVKKIFEKETPMVA